MHCIRGSFSYNEIALDAHAAKAMPTILCLHGKGTFIDTIAVALIVITVIVAHRIIKSKEYR